MKTRCFKLFSIIMAVISALLILNLIYDVNLVKSWFDGSFVSVIQAWSENPSVVFFSIFLLLSTFAGANIPKLKGCGIKNLFRLVLAIILIICFFIFLVPGSFWKQMAGVVFQIVIGYFFPITGKQ